MPHRSPRALALWAAAVGLAVATAVVAGGDLATLRRRAASLGPVRSALVARHALPLGDVITDADLDVRPVNAAHLPPATLTDRAAAVGRVVRFPVAAGSFVTARHVAPRRRDPADVLPAGTRAVRVPVVARPELRAGDPVDVYAAPTADAFGTGRSDVPAGPVAAGALVLAVEGRRASTTDADPGVTLLVDALDADAVAAARAGVVLVLVPPDDADPGLTSR